MAGINKNIVVKLSANVGDYVKDMERASKATEELGQQGTKSNPKLAVLGKYATKAGLAVGAMSVAIGTKAISTFADFDQALSDIQANTGASSDEMDKLALAAREAGRTSVYSATESANAILELAKAGMSTSDVLSGGLSGALALAASDGMQVADAAELMASTLAQFNLQGKDATAVADALAAGAAAAQGSAADLGQALSQSGMVANSFGISMQETVGTLAAFANAGMIGSDAGTSLKSMLQHLAAPSGAAARTMKELGISAYDASGNFVGLQGLAGQLKDRLSGLTPEARNSAMAVMFGSDAVRAANVLYEQGAEGIAKWTQTVSQSGIAAQMAAGKTDNLKGDLEQLGGAFEEMLLSVGEGANGGLRNIVQFATEVVDAFASLPPAVQQGVTAFGLLVGAGAGLHKMFGGLKDSTSGFAQQMGLLLDPVQRIQGLANGLHGAFTMIRQSTMSASEQIGVYGSALTRGQALTGAFKSAGQGLVSFLGGPWGIAFTVASTFIMSFIRKNQEAKQTVSDFKTALSATGDASEAMVEKINSIDFNKGIGVNSLLRDYEDFNAILQDAGISLAEFAAAAMGNEDAIKSVSGALDAFAEKGEKQNVAARVASDNLEQLQGQYAKAKAEADETAAAVDELTGATDENAAASESAAAATEKLTNAGEILAAVFGATTDAVSEQASAILQCVKALDQYYGYSTGAWDAETQLYQAFDKATESIQKNGKTLDLHTEQGRANRDALSDVVAATRRYAEAQAANGESAEKVAETMELGRSKIEEYGRAMGMNDGEIDAFIKDNGLASGSVQELIDKVNEINGTNATASVNVETSKADSAIDMTKIKVTSLPDGKVMVYGDTTDIVGKFKEIEGVEIDKEGRITATKEQYDQVMGVVKADKVEPKKVDINADPADYNGKSNVVKADKIPPKTAVINGNNIDALSKIGIVNNREVRNKSFSIIATDNASSVVASVDALQIANKSFTIEAVYTSRGELAVPEQTKVEVPKARGGMVYGPGTGTSDSIPARLSNGEFVVRAAQTAKYRPLLEAINSGTHGFAAGGLVTATPAAQYVTPTLSVQPPIQYVQNVTNRMYSTGSPRVQAELTAAKMRMATRKLVSR